MTRVYAALRLAAGPAAGTRHFLLQTDEAGWWYSDVTPERARTVTPRPPSRSGTKSREEASVL